jgi:hypothetical protein
MDNTNETLMSSEVLEASFTETLQADTETLLNQLLVNLTGITGESLLRADVKELPCLVNPFLQQTGLACLAGSSDTGKSSLLRQLAIAVATGEESVMGFELKVKHKAAIYVSTEDDELAVAMLLQKQAFHFPPESLRKLRFIFDSEDLINKLDQMLTDQPADLVIVDCFADIYGADLKDSQRIRACLENYKRIAMKHKCLVLFLHHTSKRTEEGAPSKNNLLSGQGFEAKMRLVIELRRDPINPSQRHLCIVKGNYLPDHYKKESFVLQFDPEKFCFSNTGDRMPFESLCKQSADDTEKERYELAKQMKAEGKNYDQIADAIGYAAKSSVTKLFAKAQRNGWDSAL